MHITDFAAAHLDAAVDLFRTVYGAERRDCPILPPTPFGDATRLWEAIAALAGTGGVAALERRPEPALVELEALHAELGGRQHQDRTRADPAEHRTGEGGGSARGVVQQQDHVELVAGVADAAHGVGDAVLVGRDARFED